MGRSGGGQAPRMEVVLNEQRKLWLIDAGYLIKAQRSVGQDYYLDYRRLRERLEQDAPIWRTYYLNSTPDPPTDRQNKFHSWLRSESGPKIITNLYQLKTNRVGRLYCQKCNRMVNIRCEHDDHPNVHVLAKQQQKGVDVGIVTLALTLADRYETLLLSSGDGDLLDAVRYLTENLDKQFELVVFRHGVSTELQSFSDRIHWINDFSDAVSRDQRIEGEPEIGDAKEE